MKSLDRNKRILYYANPTTPTDILDDNGLYTGEQTHGYETPIEIKLSVSAGKGNIHSKPFGDMEDYDKTITVFDLSLPFTKQTVFWIDNLDTSAAHDYTVKAISDGINSNLIAVKKVDVANGTNL